MAIRPELSPPADLLDYVPEDAYFGRPYLDADERREQPHTHRYLHGGFDGTDARFSLYLPPAERYAGRLFSSVGGGPGGVEPRAAQMSGDGIGSIGFAFTCGGCLVESNGGHIAHGAYTGRGSLDGTITAYRASAETARYARHVARQVYGSPPRYGYIFGPSGGGWRTILAAENTTGLWDGALPYISPAGNGASFPCIVGNAVRVLGPRIADAVASVEPGGSGDPFAPLGSEQRAVLAELFRAGFQREALPQLVQGVELGVLLVTMRMQKDFDPGYFEDFWTVPGYRGADGSLAAEVIDAGAVIERVVDLPELGPATRGVVLTEEAPFDLARVRGASVLVKTGVLRGARLACLSQRNGVLILAARDGDVAGLAAGDRIHVDNRDYLAYCHAYRHQADPRSVDCAQFSYDGRPIFPQRSVTVADALAGMTTTARFDCRMIYVSNRLDTLASPIGGTITYCDRVRANLGPRSRDRLRVWINDNAGHLVPARRPAGGRPVIGTRLVDYDGSIEHALRCLIDWVEDGVEPPEDTQFTYSDGRLELPARAADRLGIQPVVSLVAGGQTTTTAKVGESVRFDAVGEVPPGAGTVIEVAFDFDGSGEWADRAGGIDGSRASVRCSVEHRFTTPGTYYPAVRVHSNRHGDVPAVAGRVENLARMRVEVGPA